MTVTPTWASVTAKPSSLGPSGFAVADGIVVVFRQTASVTIGNTASETTMIGAGAGSKNLAANQLVAGSTIRVKFAGTIGIAVAVTTVRLKLKLGANTIFDSGAQILISAIAGTVISPGATVTGEFAFTVRTAGAAGNGIGQVMMWVSCVQSNNYGGIVFPIVGNSATPTIDTVTGAQAIDATLQFGAANANTTITVSNLTIQVEG